jgi:PadR family transcriptional regulator PadR
MEPGDARNVLTQLRRGTIEYCVLAVLAEGEEYAFELVRRLSAVDGLVTSEGTIYPLLSRLRRDDMVTTTWQESDAGPPRKYYRLTPKGKLQLAELNDYWKSINATISQLGR